MLQLDLDDIRATVSVNREEIESDAESVDDLIVNDFLVGLGYNRKKDKNVRKLSKDEIVDWKISVTTSDKTESLIFVSVQSLNDDTDAESKIESLEDSCDVFINVRGYYISVYAVSDTSVKCLIKDVDLTDELSDEVQEVLRAISKDEFNLSSLLKDDITPDELIEAFSSRAEELSELLNGYYSTSKYTPEIISSTVINMLKGAENTEGTECAGAVSDDIAEQLESLQKQNRELLAENGSLGERLDILSSEKKELEIKVGSLLVQINENHQEDTTSVEQYKEEIEQYKSSLIKLEEENTQLTQEIDNLKNIDREDEGSGANSESNSDEITKLKEQAAKYQEKIRELNVELGNSKEMVSNYVDEVNALKAQVEGLSGSEVKHAEDLLSMIQDDADGERGYVAVINTELFQYENIHTFIGRCLQALYEIKGFDMQRYIFNGEDYTLNGSNPKYNDMLLGSKYYDIELKSNNEIEELNRLRILFSHFSDVVFLCKTVGKKISEIPAREVMNTVDEPVRVESDMYIDADGIEEATDESGAFDESDNPELELDAGLAEFGDFEEQAEDRDCLLACALAEIDGLIWTEENVMFKDIKYIGSNDVTYSINVPSDDLDMLLCKCVDAILAIAAYNGDDNLIQRLKTKDFSIVNSFLKLYTDEYKGHPRINGTRYAIVGIESIQQVASIIGDICAEMQITTNSIFLYLSVSTDSELVMEYAYPEDGIQLLDTVNYEPDGNTPESIGIAIIRGDFSNHMVVTKNSLRAHSDVLVKALAIKTPYLSKVIESDKEVCEVVASIINEAIKHNITVNYRAIGNLIGTGHRLLSENAADVGENPLEVELIDGPLYCARMEPWQVTHSLIKMHTSLFNNTSIAVKNNVNLTALEFYDTEFTTAEPSLSLAVKSFTTYSKGCVKIK